MAGLIALIVVLLALGGVATLAIISARQPATPELAGKAGGRESGPRVLPPGSTSAPRGGNGRVVPPRSRGGHRSSSGAGRRLRKSNAELLPADATISFGEQRKDADIDGVLAGLDRDLVGLVPVKRKVEQIASLLLVERARGKFGLTAPRPNLHMCFTGPPGTGKTTMALRMADLLHRLGYLETGQLVHAMRDDLVGEFVGHTAPKTRHVLDRAMGGVLFIDEAYYLYRAADSKDYGQEVIDILLQVMESQRENLVVILAGYKDRMDEFFTMNPGMRSRIAHHLDFAPYDVDDLIAIGHLMLDEASYHLSPRAEVAFRREIGHQMHEPGFANARTVRNNLDRARLRHAHRLTANPVQQWSRDDLMRLEPEDFADEDIARAATVVTAADSARSG